MEVKLRNKTMVNLSDEGYDVTTEELKTYYGFQQQGYNMADIKQMTELTGLSAETLRYVRLNKTELYREILGVKVNHYPLINNYDKSQQKAEFSQENEGVVE